MVFILKYCDKAILRFSANEASSNPDYKILWVTDEKSLLPLGFQMECFQSAGEELTVKLNYTKAQHLVFQILVLKLFVNTIKILSHVFMMVLLIPQKKF